MNPLIQFRKSTALSLIVLLLVCFALSQTTQAVLPSPTPDGGYPGSNTAEGTNALFYLTTGTNNTAIGHTALQSNNTGNLNTAAGAGALKANTTGIENTATGAGALYSNNGGSNTANGADALYSNTTGNDNTGSGFSALFSNTSGTWNTANGYQALFFNTGGVYNTANGYQALFTNSTGGANTASGAGALYFNTNSVYNTATGASALYHNTTGNYNTATGADALHANTSGGTNTATGYQALYSNTTFGFNTADGIYALYSNTTGHHNTGLGDHAGYNLTTGSNNIDIGNEGVAGESNKIRIGAVGTHTATFVAGIYGVAVANGLAVIIDSNGHLGNAGGSSARFKDQIKPMDRASEAILALKPVTFHYKKALDPEGIQQFGLVAEDVEKVNPALITCDRDGKPYSVRYDAVNAMLLNEFLKEHRKVEQLTKNFQSKLAEQQKQIAVLTTGLQRVSAQLEASKPAAQVVNNP